MHRHFTPPHLILHFSMDRVFGQHSWVLTFTEHKPNNFYELAPCMRCECSRDEKHEGWSIFWSALIVNFFSFSWVIRMWAADHRNPDPLVVRNRCCDADTAWGAWLAQSTTVFVNFQRCVYPNAFVPPVLCGLNWQCSTSEVDRLGEILHIGLQFQQCQPPTWMLWLSSHPIFCFVQCSMIRLGKRGGSWLQTSGELQIVAGATPCIFWIKSSKMALIIWIMKQSNNPADAVADSENDTQCLKPGGQPVDLFVATFAPRTSPPKNVLRLGHSWQAEQGGCGVCCRHHI